MSDVSKILIGLGVLFIAVGVFFAVLSKIPGVGRLPGDILIKRENFTFYFPLATSLLLSVVLSLLLLLFNRR